jgi:small conductance mechanosensitive channel
MNIESIMNTVSTNGVEIGIKIAGAIAMWIIGRWLIKFVMKFLAQAFERGGKIDSTLSKYLVSIISVLLTIGLAVGILGYLGIQTTTFAALLAGAGLAIGTAWGGLLAHFAAGVFMQVLRPFKVGDYVSAGGVEGTVKEVGLFGTTIVTGDNVTTMLGNNKIFSDTIRNFSDQPYRRVEAVAKIANSVDPQDAISRLKQALNAIPNIAKSPMPDVEILEFTAEGPKLAVRPYCHTDHYWQVYFDTQKTIAKTFSGAGYPVPETPTVQRNVG